MPAARGSTRSSAARSDAEHPVPKSSTRHHVGTVERHRIAHRLRGAAQGDDQLVEPGAAGDLQGRPEQGRIPVWQKLFGRAQPA